MSILFEFTRLGNPTHTLLHQCVSEDLFIVFIVFAYPKIGRSQCWLFAPRDQYPYWP